ncbi:MAG: hypothetical protein BWY58_00529 [Chloroflexi bacterium ADurb.Bin344]|nr:MAG: hypothetical protein BWY58_00529 [Chloroflexi bacterium ADurb.Bin344]
MTAKSLYMNNFTFSLQNLTCILDAKSVAPDIERSNFGTVLDEKKTVDEVFLFMPIEAAKELGISILQMVAAQEKRTHLKIRLEPEKQVLWDCYIKAAEKSREKRNPLCLNQ